MRIFNNTEVDNAFMLELNSHLIYLTLDTSKVESITFNKNYMDVFGIDCLLASIPYNKDIRLTGTIRWFDKYSGHGSIRLDKTQQSVVFYACNVDGANSLYPQLVTNIDFNSGDAVEFNLPCDVDTLKALGVTHISKV